MGEGFWRGRKARPYRDVEMAGGPTVRKGSYDGGRVGWLDEDEGMWVFEHKENGQYGQVNTKDVDMMKTSSRVRNPKGTSLSSIHRGIDSPKESTPLSPSLLPKHCPSAQSCYSA